MGIIGLLSLSFLFLPEIFGVLIRILIPILKNNNMVLFIGYLILYFLSYYLELWMFVCIILYYILMVGVLLSYLRISLSEKKFNKEYKNKNIGNFYNFFDLKFGKTQLLQVEEIIKNDNLLNTFLLPTKVELVGDTKGKLIIRNFIYLRKKNIFAFLKLKNNILEKKNNHFLNIGAIFLSITALIISSLNNSIIFSGVFRPLVETFKNSYKGKEYSDIGNTLFSFIKVIPFCTITVLVIIVAISLIKEWEKYENRSFYGQILLFIEEVEK